MAPNVLLATADNQIGFTIARELLRENIFNRVVVGVRHLQKGKDLERFGGIVVELKPRDLSAIERTIRDHQIGHIFIIPPDSENRYDDTKAIIDIAGNLAMRCVTLMSVVGCDKMKYNVTINQQEQEEDAKEFERKGETFIDFKNCESYLKDAIKENWCILRYSAFQQCLLFLSEVIQNRGTIILPIGSGRSAWVNEKDCAIAASAILRNDDMKDEHRKKTFSITGPDCLDGQEMAILAGRALESKMSFRSIESKEMRRILTNMSGLNSNEINFLMDCFWAIKMDHQNLVTDDYKTLTGMEGEKMLEFFRENSDQFRPGHGP